MVVESDLLLFLYAVEVDLIHSLDHLPLLLAVAPLVHMTQRVLIVLKTLFPAVLVVVVVVPLVAMVQEVLLHHLDKVMQAAVVVVMD